MKYTSLTFLSMLLLQTMINNPGFCQSEMPPPRRELNSLSSSELITLRTLILNWVPAYVTHHLNCDCHGNNTFFIWHRDHIQQLEQYLIVAGYPNFVPLPKWSPNTLIPDKFMDNNSVLPGNIPNGSTPYLPPTEQNPASVITNFNARYSEWDDEINTGTELARFCGDNGGSNDCQESSNHFDDFRTCLESFHNAVHLAVGGSFANVEVAAGVALFWPWHAWVDEVYERYLCICNDDDDDYFSTSWDQEEWDSFDREVDNISTHENSYSAFRYLSTDGNVLIPLNREITFRAGSSIELNNNFEALGIFYAYIDACPRYVNQNPSRINADYTLDAENYPENNESDRIEIITDSFKKSSKQEYVNLSSDEIKNDANSYKLIPNPSAGYINFISDLSIPYQLLIYNMDGKTVYSFSGADNNRLIDLSSLAKGVYISKVIAKNNAFIERIIIK